MCMRQLATSIRCLITWKAILRHLLPKIMDLLSRCAGTLKISEKGAYEGIWILGCGQCYCSLIHMKSLKEAPLSLPDVAQMNWQWIKNYIEHWKTIFRSKTRWNAIFALQIMKGEIHPYKFPSYPSVQKNIIKSTSVAWFIMMLFGPLLLREIVQKKRKMHVFEKTSSRRYVRNLADIDESSNALARWLIVLWR